MKFIEKVVENGFKNLDTGERVFYPNGAIGSGRLVESSEVEEKIKSLRAPAIKYLFFIFIPLTVLSIKLAVIALIPSLFFMVREHLFFRTLPVHNSKLGFSEAAGKGAKILPNWYFIILGAVSIFIIILAVMLPVISHKSINDVLFSLIEMGSFGLLGLGFSWKMYQIKKNAE